MTLSPSDETRIRSAYDDWLQRIQKDMRNIVILTRRLAAVPDEMTSAFAEGGRWDTNHVNPDVAALNQSFEAAWVALYGAFSAGGVPVAALDMGSGNTSVEAILLAAESALTAFDDSTAAASVDNIGMLDLPEVAE